jgi:type VI secretion system protein ImpC
MSVSGESLLHNMDRIRRNRRVQITYDVESEGRVTRKELPFVVGVLADLSGQSAPPVPLRDRKFISIDRDNFDAVLKAAAPRLAFRVPDVVVGQEGRLEVALCFQSMKDFEPARVARQVPVLQKLLDARQQMMMPTASEISETKLAEIDQSLSAQLQQIMHHPEFQQLEGTWRGLRYLASQTESGELLKIRVLNVTKRELHADQESAVEYHNSVLFKKVYTDEFCGLGTEPYGLLVGDYQFSHAAEDIFLLKGISHVAAAAHAPFVASASLKMFSVVPFDASGLTFPNIPAVLFDGPEYAAWKSFRESEDSRYTALTLPRVLSRLLYGDGENMRRVEELNFNEDPFPWDRAPWMNSTWAHAVCVTKAFAKYGWMVRIRGHLGGGKVEGLPVLPWDPHCPAEITISARRELELSSLGFLPLHHDWDNTLNSYFMSAQSCHQPRQHSDGTANSDAEWSAKLNLLVCVSRFVHYLKIMARNTLGSFMEIADCERWLNDWIMNFCVDPEGTTLALQAQRPLSEARVEIRSVAGKPGWYELVVFLRPHYQLEAFSGELRLVAEIPRRDPG